jgi:glyoxylase-like metal-dependent hydrolase (beta-lactamase superfamily II)
VQVQEPGRARPHAEAVMDQFALNGMSWNLTPAPTAIPTNLAERNAELWCSPQGFVKAALAHKARVRVDKEGVWASFRIGVNRYEGWFSREGDVRHVQTLIDSPVLGDTLIEFDYADYRDFGGVRFPAHVQRKVAGLPWYDLDVSAVRVNVAAPFEVPPEIVANPLPSNRVVEVTELAPGVWNFGGGTHNSVVVEQQSGLVVIEAPLNEERSLALLDEIHKRFPGRQVREVINTHAHFDHAGGLRTFVAAGIAVITHERNAVYYQKVWQQPHTLNPDRLAKAPTPPIFASFTDKLVLNDATHPIEIHTIEGSGHNDAIAMVYLPAQKLLVEADVWTPTPPGSKPPAVVNPLWVNLYDNVRRLGLDVQRVAPLHGSVQDFATLRAAIGR